MFTLGLFIWGAWLTCTPLSQMQFAYPDTLWQDNENTSTWLVEFNEPMDTVNLCNKNNYSVTDVSTGVPLVIQKIGIVRVLDDAPVVTPPIIVNDNRLIAIITNRATYKHNYHIVVTGVKDINGNYIQTKNDDYFYFDGIRGALKTTNVNVNR